MTKHSFVAEVTFNNVIVHNTLIVKEKDVKIVYKIFTANVVSMNLSAT